MAPIISLLFSAIAFGTIIIFGALGEILAEKSGSLNLGVPGIMYLGGIAGLAATFFYERTAAPLPWVCVVLALLSAFAAAAFGGLIFSFLTITLRANQNVAGLTLTIFGSGVANFFGGSLNTLAGGVGQISVPITSAAFRQTLPLPTSLGSVGRLLFSHGFLVYTALLIAVVLQVLLHRTRVGLNLRAVGENPATADAAGIRVNRYKYLSVTLGAGISGLGGLFYVMDYIKGTWANDGTIERLGWLAVALVIFTTWKPVNAIWGAYLFGFLYWMHYIIPGLNRSSQSIFKMIPYVVTILVLVVISLRKKRENQAPTALGLSYFREER
ncbi:MAG: ABC transporter permease [Eubacteriales bacterium]